MHDGINDGEHRISHVVHNEGAYTAKHHIKAFDWIALLIKVGRLGGELLLESRTYGRQEVLVTQVIEEVKVRKVLLMNLLADFEPQMHR